MFFEIKNNHPNIEKYLIKSNILSVLFTNFLFTF